MKKPTIFKNGLIVLLILFSVQLFAQNYVPFSGTTSPPRFDQDLKGDIVLIGNNILGPSNNAYNNNNETNDDVNMRYIDIDSDGSTFSSSSADLLIPINPDIPIDANDCYEIVHAALYWSAVVKGPESINNVKLKGPIGGYNDIVADEVIFDAGSSSVDGGNSFPYVCYADVTDIIRALGTDQGTYTVANVSSAQGRTDTFGNHTGYSAGWSLFIVYQNPSYTGKSITSYDGFSTIRTGFDLDIPISGFRTVPAPAPVYANFAFAALEGDKPLEGDRLRINGTRLSDTDRLRNNFFDSSVSSIAPRNPNSSNTLGFDTGVMMVPNADNDVIGNGDSGATVRLETSQDTYFPYFFALAVDIIAPNLVLTKTVEDAFGNDISGTLVDLGDELNYVLGIQNTGNDNATEATIRDVLPRNIDFDYPADIGLLPSGVTVQSYDAATRELIFAIDDSVVEEFDPMFEIRFKVTVVRECSLLNNACDNIVSNQAFSKYKGTLNQDFTISDDPSYSANTGCLITPAATNFLADIDCTFEEDVILCGANVTLEAGDDYDTYLWSTGETSQSITVTAPGVYTVRNTATAPCQSIDQIFNVITYGAGVTNPVIPFANEVVRCPDDGVELPYIFMCGANDTRFIETNITDADNIVWEKLDETQGCPAVANIECANTSTDISCVWNTVQTGADYLVDSPGQYKLTLNYSGGCSNVFYFNVYENVLVPTATSRDIICTTPGEIVVGDVPISDYEYSIDNVNYQASNIFSITTPDIYTVYIRQTGLISNPCIFTVPNIQVRERNFTVSTNIIQPLCNNEQGSVIIAANDVRPQYYFSISQGGGTINNVGPIDANSYTFPNLNPGIYTIDVSTDDGCVFTGNIEIENPAELTASAALTTPLTACADGEITVYPVGGSGTYYYYINGATEFETIPTIPVVAPGGVYDIRVVDSNNCSVNTSITVNEILPPDFSVTKTDILCYNDNNGQIVFNVTNANGNTIAYSIDNGATYVTNPTFSNLSGGTYQTMIRYSLSGTDCFSTVQNIIIDQPSEALTASSGISELAGCGPSGEGRLRITNPQGGTPFPGPNFYEYSFDNQATWVTTNEAYVLPGTYTLYVRDANGCIYAMPDIILDPEPVPPTINIGNPDFNCDGTATSTVTVNNTGGSSYEYTYLLDGVVNTNTTNPEIFLNVPSGPHEITVQYRLLTVPTYSNLLNEDFGYGEDTTSPGINTTYYCFERQEVGTECGGHIGINDGEYSVTSDIIHLFGGWLDPVDHTPATVPVTPDGRFLVVNIGATIPTTAILYEKTINDIIPNRPINVEFFAMNLISSSGSSLFDPDITVALIDGSGTEISSFSTGNIPKSEQWENYPKTPMTLNPGANTSLRFIIRSNVQQTSGNDLALDDIRVFQLPASCVTEVNFPFVIDSNNAFTSQITNATDVTCLNANDGTITIAAQNFDTTNGFQYSIDNGTTWNTQLTSPHTITGLAAGTYNVLIRYDAAATTCMDTFTQNITSPNLLEVNASGTPITCLVGSTVTATATGGTAAYSYELLDATTLNLVTNFPSSGILNDVSSGDYIVRVTDAKNCQANTSTTLSLSAPTNPIASIDGASNLCYDTTTGATIVVGVTGGQAPFEYNINAGPFGSSNTFANLLPGTYTLTVRDANGCTDALAPIIIAPQLTANAVLTKDLDCTASPDALITGTVSGGIPPYEYQVSRDGGLSYNSTIIPITGTTFTHLTATAGDYRFRIIDASASGCVAESNITTVNPIVLPTATIASVNPNCFGDTDGSIVVTASSGVPPYEYSIDNGVTFQTSNVFNGLTVAGSPYNVIVRDSKECTYSDTVILTEPAALIASHVVTPFDCNTTTSAAQPATVVVTVDGTTGTGPYEYSFNGSAYSTTSTLTVNDDGTSQNITYSVRDAKGCTFNSTPITLAPLDPPTDLAFASLPITCVNTTSDVTLTPTNGVGSLTYTILSPASATGNVTGAASGIFTGLAPDAYTFRVTDANGCFYTESYTIDPVVNITVSGMLVDNVSCIGGTDGAISFTVGNFATTYSYTINGTGGATGETLTTVPLGTLSANTYLIEVTDDITGCVATTTVNVGEPLDAPTISSTTSTNVSCTNANSQITVTVAGGTPNYRYAAVVSGAGAPGVGAYGNNNIITVDTNLGTDLVWDVYVLDDNGCPATSTATIVSDPLPTVTATVSNQCSDGTSGFTITATPGGGLITPLSYSINGGTTYQTSPLFNGLAPGTYTVTIRDGNGCTATSAVTTILDPLTASAILTKDLTCSSPVNASMNVTVAGGNGPYSYKVKIGTGAYGGTIAIVGTTFTYNLAATADTYQFEITDANGCTVETNVITTNIPVNPDVTAVASTTETILCFGEDTAAIDVTIDTTQGLAPFTINVHNDTESTNYGTQTSGLSAGTYTITVTDANGCTDTDTVIINQPADLNVTHHAVPITCTGVGISSGSIIVDGVTGGTGPYNYFVTGTNGYSNSEFNATGTASVAFNVVDFGLYQIRVVDSNGCNELIQDVLVASPPSNLDVTITPLPTTCTTGGTVVVSVGGALTGNGPYHFAIYTGPGITYTAPTTAPWQDADASGTGETSTFTNLTPGVTYSFIIFDEVTQCYYFEQSTVPIETNSTLTANAVVENNISCTGSADGNVSFDITSIYSGTTDVIYEVFNSHTLATTGITGSGTVPANGTLPVANLGPLPVGTYFVLVTEDVGANNAGCSVTTSEFNITESTALLEIEASVSKNANCNELGIITATAQFGTAPYEYQAVISGDPLGAWSTANTFNLAGSLAYDIYVRDAYGCVQSDTETLPTDALPTINSPALQCYVGTPLNIVLSGTAPVAPATYSMGGAYQVSPNFTINGPGTYTLSIRDGNGCEASVPYVVQPQLLLNAALTQDLECLGVDAIITLTPSGGTGVGPYTYEVSFNSGTYGPISGPGATHVASTDGDYQFRVTNSQTCDATSNVVTIDPLVPPTSLSAKIDVSCNGLSDGSIVVTASNGISPYQYSIDNGTTFQASNDFPGLPQGTYNVIVRDAKNCDSALEIVTIDEPLVLNATASVTTPLSCNTTTNATQPGLVTVTVDTTTGTGPYEYSFNGSGFSATNTLTVNDTGVNQIIAYSVRDDKGCTFSDTVNITALNPPTAGTITGTDVTCNDTTSTVTVTPAGGTGVGTLTYEITSPAASATSNTTGIFTLLAPDTYTFKVTDANGCFYTESYTVDPVTNITVSGSLVDNISCTGSSDGAISFTVGNFAGTYSYTINGTGGATGETLATIAIGTLSANTYLIEVTDDITGCVATATVDVEEALVPLDLTATATNIFCTNDNSQITITEVGGTPNYTYAAVISGTGPPALAAYGNSNIINVNTNSGTDLVWDVYVRDANDCAEFETVTIINDPLPTVTVPPLASNQCTVASGFTFTAIPGTGLVTPLSFSIDGGVSFQTNPTFTVNAAGSYTVTIKDGHGCTGTSATVITVFEPLASNATLDKNLTCSVPTEASIDVTVAGGNPPYGYRVNIASGGYAGVPIAFVGTTFTYSASTAATYQFEITDANGCTTQTDVVRTFDPTPVTFTTTPTDISCNGGNDGVITVNLPTSNDDPVYTYEITAPIVRAPQTSNVFTGLTVGTYTIQVNSAKGCFGISTQAVNEPNLIVPSTSVVEYACSVGANTPNFASITVDNAVGGSGTFSNYEFIRGGTVEQFGPNNVFIESDLLGGTYTINVYDNNGCVGSTTETILPFINIQTVNITIDNAITCTNDEDITVSVASSGGIPPNLEYTVEDVVGVTIGGIYSQTNSTGVFTGLAIGNYFVTVTNLDTNCSIQTTHYVVDPNTFDLTIDTVVDVTCFSDSDGSVNITFIDRSPIPTDESGAFNYNIINDLGSTIRSGSASNAGPITLSNFSAGTYTINASLVNAPFCIVNKNFTIERPTRALDIQETHTEITCVSGNNDGAISVTADGGWPGGYEFQLEEATRGIITSYSNVFDFSGLIEGDYTVRVRDSRGCIDFVNVLLEIPDPINATVTPSTTLLDCYGDTNATITVSAVTGGQGPIINNYSYTLNTVLPTPSSSGPQISPVFTDLGAGTYNVTVTDGFNCTYTTNDVVITQPTEVIATLMRTDPITCPAGGTLELTATGGTGTYTYGATENYTTPLGTLPATLSVADGTYVYYVRDANGCATAKSNEVTIEPLVDLALSFDSPSQTIYCKGDNTGVINATAEGGIGNYVYTLLDATGTINITPVTQDSPGVFTNLVAGTYQVRVDSGGCSDMESIQITEPNDPLIVTFTEFPLTCSGANDGILEIEATGGTGIIKYAISPSLNQFFESPIFTDLEPGIYQAIAQDELGCLERYDFEIFSPDPVFLSMVPGSITAEICEGDLNGSFSVDIIGGNMPYSVALDDIDGTYTTGTATQTQFDFNNLGGGDHIVYVRDALGCESEWDITFPESIRINPEAVVAYSCTGNISTNTVTVTVDESITGSTDLEYALNGNAFQNSNVFVNVPPGLNHYIDVRHVNGCSQRTENFDISQFEPLTLVLEDGGLNEIVAVTSGGAAPYEYTLNGESYGSTNTFIIYASGDYTVTVTDSNGCVAVASRYFEYIDVCISNYFTPNGDNDLDEWGPGCTSQYEDLTFDVFDRYGRAIATLRVGEKWDGSYNGSQLPSGDYWYILKLNDPKDDREIVGHFTLYR
ncbi:T9SS type B sorting domain-containing protein [Flavivirga jejuensis]|uniref:T9SS type B sorting domain-containing protein n=1 Tax=Flavivirga jejuensis TaxID=870487 RepID=A0ABT8WTG8_9FLAO|nr:T9SS type B sorting domain-containing protein [Flavivirga jejuensis]MDO5976181.1 T9SS type B sorting domain-containing protein [Flavivirga jejuensis]